MDNTNTKELNWNEFMKVEMRVDTIIGAEVFKEAKKIAGAGLRPVIHSYR